MTLSLSSVLHYWSGRYGVMPVIGGKPVHARNSAARWTDQQGVVQSSIVNTPRFTWMTIDGERRQVLQLEMARTNHVANSTELDVSPWVPTNLSVVGGMSSPAGDDSAYRLEATATDGELLYVNNSTNEIRRGSVWVRRIAGAGVVSMYRPDGNLVAIVPSADWQRFTAMRTTANGGKWAGIKIGTSGDIVDVWNPQVEDVIVNGNSPSTDIRTAGVAATRAADEMRWNFVAPPQAFMLYLRFVARHLESGAGHRIVNVGDNGSGDSSLLIYDDPYVAYLHNGVAADSSALAVSPTPGDVVELLLELSGTGTLRLSQSINGAAVSSGATSGALALPSEWSGPAVFLNSCAGPAAVGMNEFAELKIVKFNDVVAATAQGRMEELRGFELGANGAVL